MFLTSSKGSIEIEIQTVEQLEDYLKRYGHLAGWNADAKVEMHFAELLVLLTSSSRNRIVGQLERAVCKE